MSTPHRYDETLESSIHAKGKALFARMKEHPAPGILSRKGVYARLMDWAMKDPDFKTQLFRFVDVLPTLEKGSQVIAYLREYLGGHLAGIHPALEVALRASALMPGLTAGLIRAQITDMARQFVAGKDATDAARRFRSNEKTGRETTIDLLGEAVVNEREADLFLQRNFEILDTLSSAGPGGRPLPGINLSLKISALSSRIRPEDPEFSVQSLTERLLPLIRKAAEVGAFINFDMESYHLKEITIRLFKAIFSREEFRRTPAAGIVVQAYLRDAADDLRGLIGWARQHERFIGIRLVKGAYWDYEVTMARQRGWPIPVWLQKPQSDANFESLSALLLENVATVRPAFASHNVRSVAHAMARAEAMGISSDTYEFQVLYGMADELQAALLASGRTVREYCPVGDLLPGMAYLVRRLLENTSNEGFLRAHHGGAAKQDELLANPLSLIQPDPESTPMQTSSFTNAVNTDFTLAENRDAFSKVLHSLPGSFGRRWPLVIGGRRVSPPDFAPSVNPADPGQIVGYWACGRREDAEAAVHEARQAFPAWAARPAEERIAILERAADLMEARRFELNAVEVYEAGKPWAEADADISEAIDFCRFYAAEMREISQPRTTRKVAGEDDTAVSVPRGVGVVIAPWNFPLAILCGMTVAPLVAGNAVVMKPAEQTTVIAAIFMEILEEAGVPAGVVNFLSGDGEEIGPVLVAHPQVDFIAFTGSRSVGLQIWETAGRTLPGQANLKKVVCEMGGKNAMIIDVSADLDEAVPAALYSAFGFAGQKCSALSRLIVLEEIYDRFVARFVEAADSFPVGSPMEPGIMMGPVIDSDARDKILRMIEQGKAEADLAYQGSVPDAGYYVPLTIFTGVPPTASIARQEIFGPVVAVLKAKDLDDAFRLANDSEYALTGGLFSRSPAALERAKREFNVGNLYLNRGVTGAIVERHPFGGFRMSGGGTKAGGKGYLENFLFSKTIAENVLRRGFTPEPPTSSR